MAKSQHLFFLSLSFLHATPAKLMHYCFFANFPHPKKRGARRLPLPATIPPGRSEFFRAPTASATRRASPAICAPAVRVRRFDARQKTPRRASPFLPSRWCRTPRPQQSPPALARPAIRRPATAAKTKAASGGRFPSPPRQKHRSIFAKPSRSPERKNATPPPIAPQFADRPRPAAALKILPKNSFSFSPPAQLSSAAARR